jgi:DNA-binding response OmpR family regulator
LLHASYRTRDLYLARALTQAGHVVDSLESLDDATTASADDYDAVLLEVADLADAPLAGLSRCADRAIVVLIADRASPADRAAALRSGADACLIRPVHVVELEARLTALARLSPTLPSALPQTTTLSLHAASRTANLDGHALPLPGREYALLAYMAEHPGEVLTAEQVLGHVWGETDDPRPERVRTAVARLRQKLEATFGRPFLITVRGHGYRFDANMKEVSSG